MPKKGFVKAKARKKALRASVAAGWGHGPDGRPERLGIPPKDAMARDLKAGYRL